MVDLFQKCDPKFLYRTDFPQDCYACLSCIEMRCFTTKVTKDKKKKKAFPSCYFVPFVVKILNFVR